MKTVINKQAAQMPGVKILKMRKNKNTAETLLEKTDDKCKRE